MSDELKIKLEQCNKDIAKLEEEKVRLEKELNKEYFTSCGTLICEKREKENSFFPYTVGFLDNALKINGAKVRGCDSSHQACYFSKNEILNMIKTLQKLIGEDND